MNGDTPGPAERLRKLWQSVLHSAFRKTSAWTHTHTHSTFKFTLHTFPWWDAANQQLRKLKFMIQHHDKDCSGRKKINSHAAQWPTKHARSSTMLMSLWYFYKGNKKTRGSRGGRDNFKLQARSRFHRAQLSRSLSSKTTWGKSFCIILAVFDSRETWMRLKIYLIWHKSREGQRKATRSLMLDCSVNKLITFPFIKYNCDSHFTLRHLALWEIVLSFWVE